jgi:ribosome modulation factor
MNAGRLVWKAIRQCPEAYDEGQEASMARKSVDTCPYERVTLERVAWLAGWWGV